MAQSLRTLLLCTALTLMACKQEPAPPPPPPEVSVAAALQKPVKDWDEFTGRLHAIENVEIRPRVSGYIDRIEFEEGKLVKQGELLVRIDPRPYQADADRAVAELRRARVAQELAEKELKRVERLKESGAVSAEEVDERISGLHQAEANVAAAKAAADSALLQLSFTRVTSPIDGRVSRAEVTRGNLVSGGNNGGTLLTTVVSLDPIYVDFEGDEGTYLRYGQLIRSGERPSPREVNDPAEIGLANEEGFPHPGEVVFVDNQINPQTGTVRVRAKFDNKQNFFTPGLFVRIRVLGTAEHPAVLVADSAIGTDQNQKYVLVVGADGLLEYRGVKLGRIIDGLRVVRSGLKEGEQVVVDGLQRVRPGQPVTPKPVAMSEFVTAAPAAKP